MEKVFQETKKLMDEYDELERAHKVLLRSDSMKLSYVDMAYDGPGISYAYFSDNLKRLFLSTIENRMKEIKQKFN